jgi:hypothetical protein
LSHRSKREREEDKTIPIFTGRIWGEKYFSARTCKRSWKNGRVAETLCTELKTGILQHEEKEKRISVNKCVSKVLMRLLHRHFNQTVASVNDSTERKTISKRET